MEASATACLNRIANQESQYSKIGSGLSSYLYKNGAFVSSEDVMGDCCEALFADDNIDEGDGIFWEGLWPRVLRLRFEKVSDEDIYSAIVESRNSFLKENGGFGTYSSALESELRTSLYRAVGERLDREIESV